MNGNCACPPTLNPINIIQGTYKTFYLNLFYADTGQPFDLTGASEIKVSFPGTSGTPVVETKTASTVVITGAPGAGLIQVICSAVDTALMQVNPGGPQLQDLQCVVTLSSKPYVIVAQAVLNISAPPYAVP